MTYTYKRIFMMTRFFFFVLITCSFISCISQDKNEAVAEELTEDIISNPRRDSVFRIAASDYAKDSLKYYYHGIASCPIYLSTYLYDNYSITVVNNIEILDEGFSYYNQFVDSVLVKNTGKTFHDMFKELPPLFVD